MIGPTLAAADWPAAAACGGSNSRTFVTAQPSQAKEICGGCSVRAECLYDALASKATNGIWGGLTYHERRALPVLPADSSAALNVLRQLLSTVAAAAPAKATEPKNPKAPVRRKKPTAEPGTELAVPMPRRRAARKAEPAAAEPREDVAALLREGVTHRQIMKRLKVSSPVVTVTRQAYGIPHRTGPGHRYSPEQRAEYEQRTLELLRAKASFSQIIEQVGISAPTIIRIRRQAGLEPSGQTGGHPARTKADALVAHMEPYGNGHARWTGPMSGRLPQLYAERTRFNARQVVFELHYGRPPVGRIFSGCGVTACIAGAHLTDHTLRTARPKEAPPVTVQALKNLLDEIDEQGGPQAARDNRLHLTHPTGPTTEESDTVPTTTDAEPMPPGRGLTAAQAEAETLKVSVLLKWGDEHPDPDVQDQAARGRAILTALRNRHAADAELTALATEREQLEKRLAELHAREAELAPVKKAKRKTATVVRDYDSRTVRAWAEDNGIDCPRVGQVPKRVLDAWRAANIPASGGS
ncbi:WhiB family transcriptional regulator [Streptomyces canus]|uniref:WhiB family transcriptional regulator n=1 Tax=Streptomyces canus TaxID=58343 RepID=UPI00386B1DB2